MLRLVQRGSPTGALVAGFLLGPMIDPALREALGPEATILADVDGKPQTSVAALRAFAAVHADLAASAPLVLVGFSLGCSAVRGLLDEAEHDNLVAVVAMDGTHASMPPAPSQLDPWKRVVDAARSNDLLAVLTHTMNTYTEQLPTAQRFLCTWSVLKLVTGLPLTELGTIDDPEAGIVTDGELVVYGFQSARIDAKAHGLQELRALPYVLARHVRPFLAMHGAASLPATIPNEPAPAPGPTEPTLTLDSRGGAVVGWQRWLEAHGYVPGRADGIFGPETAAATRAFQSAAGLPQTGIVDAATWAASSTATVPS